MGTEQTVRLLAEWRHGDATILSRDAVNFVIDLVRAFRPSLKQLLEQRQDDQAAYNRGQLPDFNTDTLYAREGNWQVDPLPEWLQMRHVEITGPPDRKMVINALNSGADVYMADFEDSCSPTWANIINGQRNLYDAIRRTIKFVGSKVYTLKGPSAVLFVRPRGLHLPEGHLQVDGKPAPACLVDFGLFLYHNAQELLLRGRQPCFYLPKLQRAREAAWWKRVFEYSEETLGLNRGTVKATVLIETLPAAFEMEEILYELRHHSAGLNCGRWDYIFSYIKTLRDQGDGKYLLPDRARVTMETPFMEAYSRLLVQTCHRRGAHAMGGMAAQIPIKGDPQANDAAFARVRDDKLREVARGHDGTWVAHPGLIGIARGAMCDGMANCPNQLAQIPTGEVTRDDLLRPPEDRTCTLEGLKTNLKVSLQYLMAWLSGNGCVPLNDLMEDAATAEISRAQVWQQLRCGIWTPEQVDDALADVMAEVMPSGEAGQRLANETLRLLRDMLDRGHFHDFLTLPAYKQLLAAGD